MLIQNGDGFQEDLQVAGPPVQCMNHHDIELALGGILQQLPKDRALGYGIAVGTLALFPVDAQRFQAPGNATLLKLPALGVQGMTIYLVGAGDPYVGDGPHDFRCWLRWMIAKATSAKVSRKWSIAM